MQPKLMNALLGIKSVELRNTLRGFSSNNYSKAGLKTLDNARRQVTQTDIEAFSLLLSESSASKQIYGEPFPRHQRYLLVSKKSNTSIKFELEAQIQWSRLRENEERIGQAASLISVVNKDMLQGRLSEALDVCSSLYDEFGVSTLLYRKLLYFYFKAPEIYRNSSEQNIGESKDDLLKRLFTGHEALAFSHYVDSLIDYFDTRTDLVDLMSANRRRLQQTANRPDDRIMHALLRRIALPCSINTLSHDDQFLLTSTTSLVDVFIDLSTLYSISGWVPPNSDEIDAKLVGHMKSLWLEEDYFREFISLDHIETLDQATYRLSTALPEVKFIASYRQSLDSQLTKRSSWAVEPEDQCADYFRNDLKLKHLSTRASSDITHISFFENPTAGSFSRTFAVLNRLNSGDSFRDLDGDQIRLLLSQTTGFSQFLSIEEVLGLREHGNEIGSDVVTFLAMIILHFRSPNDDEIYELRRAFQTLLQDKFKGSIIEFLDWLKGRTPELCISIINLCQIPFLEKLYVIFSKYEEVLEERQRICRWAASKLDRPDFEVAADRLALDAKVRAIRGDIDDTRIYVDEVRYGVWLTENIVPELRKVQRFLEVSGINDPSTKAPPKIPSGCLLHLNHACSISYKEFCENNVFGINSYLSRRIRHGTFRGQLTSPVKTTIDQYLTALQSCPASYGEELYEFMEAYKKIILTARSTLLHFKSKVKPHGVLNSNYESVKEKVRIKEKWHENVMQLFEAGHSSEEISPLFEDYCWATLEYDLSQARSELKAVFSKRVRPLIRALKLGGRNDHRSSSFRNELDRLVEELFSNVASWFTKPERKSMIVSIGELIQVTAEEINDLDPNKWIKLDFAGDADQNLVGGVYHTMFDILYVFFGNVQEHSNLNQNANLEVVTKKTGDGVQTIQFHIKSKISESETKETVLQNIEKSLKETKSKDPMINEGKSGLGKVANIVALHHGNFQYDVDDTHCQFSGEIRVLNPGVD